MGLLRSRPKRAVRMPDPGWAPSTWATRVPLTHLENFGEVARAAWANRDRAGYAWRILNDGVCDGCALGTTGLRGLDRHGVHLCRIRLNLLRLNTMPAATRPASRTSRRFGRSPSSDLRDLGRLPVPLFRRRGRTGLPPVSLGRGDGLLANRLAATEPDRTWPST